MFVLNPAQLLKSIKLNFTVKLPINIKSFLPCKEKIGLGMKDLTGQLPNKNVLIH